MQCPDISPRLAPLLLAPLALAACAVGRADPGPAPSPAGPDRDDDAMSPYYQVITGDAVSDDGLFAVHQEDEDALATDIVPAVRGQLATLARDVRAGAGRTRDRATRLHYEDVLVRIEAFLDPAPQS